MLARARLLAPAWLFLVPVAFAAGQVAPAGSPSGTPAGAPSKESPKEDPEESLDRLVGSIPEGYAFVHMAERVAAPAEIEYLPFTFSPDGSRVAFLAAKKDRIYGFLNGDDIGYGHMGRKPIFSENGEHVIMALGKTNKNRSEKWVVYVDGDDVAKEDWISSPTVSDDGNTIAYWIKPSYRLDPAGEPILNHAAMVLGTRKSKRFRQKVSDTYSWANTGTTPRLNEDGSRAIGAAYDQVGNGIVLSVGGSKDEFLSAKEGYLRQTAYSKDLKHFATVRTIRQKSVKGYRKPETVAIPRYQIDVDGEDLTLNADAAGLPRFADATEHYAFVYLRDDQFGLGIDGQLLEPSEHMILEARPSNSGGRIVWIEHRDGELSKNLWLNRNVNSSLYQGKSHVCSGYVVENDDGLALEEVAVSKPYDRIYGFHYSPNQDKVAFVALVEQYYFVVCGEQQLGPFEAVDRIHWVDDGTLAVGTREGNEFWWRTLKLAE